MHFKLGLNMYIKGPSMQTSSSDGVSLVEMSCADAVFKCEMGGQTNTTYPSMWLTCTKYTCAVTSL